MPCAFHVGPFPPALAWPFIDPLEGSDDDDDEDAESAAQNLADLHARGLTRHPGHDLTSRRAQRSHTAARADIEEKQWEDTSTLFRLAPSTRASRTGVALRELREDCVDKDFFASIAVRGLYDEREDEDGQGLSALCQRADPMASPGSQLLHNELRCAIILAKRVIGSRYEQAMISGIEMVRYARGLTDEDHASFIMARMPCRAVLYCRTFAEYDALLHANPHLDAHDFDGIGTYLIVVLFRNEDDEEEVATYVGACFNEPMSWRHAYHDARFQKLKDAEEHGTNVDVAKAQGKQDALYRRRVIATRHILLTQTPPELPAAHTAQWQAWLAYRLLDKSIELLGEGRLGMAQVLRMVTSMDEHVMCALFNCIGNKGYPGGADINEARWPGRQEGQVGAQPRAMGHGLVGP